MSLSIDIIINADQTESTSYLNGFDLKIRIRVSLHSFVHSFSFKKGNKIILLTAGSIYTSTLITTHSIG